ncbi:MAG: DUF6807 family protein [Pirellulaceae bacterium]
MNHSQSLASRTCLVLLAGAYWLAATCYCYSQHPQVNATTGFELVRDSQGVSVSQSGKPVLTFQSAANQLDGVKPYRRAHYVHPLYDLAGNVISEDFPVDHRHHRGVFWAWHQVLVGDQVTGDPWLCDAFDWESDSIETRIENNTAVIDATAIWHSPKVVDAKSQPVDIARDHVEIVIHPRQEQSREIDFTIELTALVPNVRIGGSDDDKGYGGFSPRLRMPKSLMFFSQQGPVKPTTNPVTADRWMLFRSDEFSYAILVAKDNPTPNDRWILRQKRSMQNPVFPGRTPVALTQDKPITLRYRMVILSGGDQPQHDVAAMLKQYDESRGQ